MSRTLAALLIVFVTAMHLAWASGVHFPGTDHTDNAACVVGDCDPGETHHVATDPDHCAHGSAHLVGMLSGALPHSLPESTTTPATTTIYFSVVSVPPTTPPKA